MYFRILKGISSLGSNNIEKKLKHAFEQIHGDDYRYPPETHREGKVIILSKHDASVSTGTILDAINKGYQQAFRKGYISGKLEVWIRGERYSLN